MDGLLAHSQQLSAFDALTTATATFAESHEVIAKQSRSIRMNTDFDSALYLEGFFCAWCGVEVNK